MKCMFCERKFKKEHCAIVGNKQICPGCMAELSTESLKMVCHLVQLDRRRMR